MTLLENSTRGENLVPPLELPYAKITEEEYISFLEQLIDDGTNPDLLKWKDSAVVRSITSQIEGLSHKRDDSTEISGERLLFHMRRVSVVSGELALAHTGDRKLTSLAALSGYLHDAGKLAVYRKNSYLMDESLEYTEEDIQLMAEHTGSGMRILEGIDESGDFLVPAYIAGAHHIYKPNPLSTDGVESSRNNLMQKILGSGNLTIPSLRFVLTSVVLADNLDSTTGYREYVPKSELLTIDLNDFNDRILDELSRWFDRQFGVINPQDDRYLELSKKVTHSVMSNPQSKATSFYTLPKDNPVS